ncbi:MAG TPA: hypothetical protein VFZ73_09020 [Gemmatimonadaceae bacterium]
MRTFLFFTVMVLVTACGGGGAGGSAQPSTASRIRGPANLITEAEINAGTSYQNALEVVQNLRPQMLIPRGVGSDASGLSAASIPIIVYMDDVRLGEVQSLVNIPSNRIKEIRFMNARDATTRFGTGHSSGVILVVTKQ